VSEIQLILFLVETLRYRMADARLEPDRGDVAEKVVIVAIFVALAIAVARYHQSRHGRRDQHLAPDHRSQ